MRIGVHTGTGNEYGLGHASRMKALATALVAQGASVDFLTQTPELVHFVAPLPCRLYRQAWPEWKIDVLIEDVPCQSPSVWYESLRTHYRVVRADAPTATPATCDLLIAPVAHWDARKVEALRAAFGPRFLYGWDYVLLDEAVTQMPMHAPGPVVFCAGGSDPQGMLSQMLAGAGAAPDGQDWVTMVPQYGTGTPALPHGVRAAPFSRDLARQAAVLITTFGVTCYEALYWGVPALMLGATHSAREDAVRLMYATRGAVRAVGLPDPGFPDSLRQLIMSLMEQRVERQRMTNASDGLIDGMGAQRCAAAILALEEV